MTDVCLILMSYHMHIFIDYSFSNHSLNEEFQSGISIWFQGFSPGANLVLALNLHMILVFYQGELSTIQSLHLIFDLIALTVLGCVLFFIFTATVAIVAPNYYSFLRYHPNCSN